MRIGRVGHGPGWGTDAVRTIKVQVTAQGMLNLGAHEPELERGLGDPIRLKKMGGHDQDEE
jgi:hypothetical protein